MHVCSHTHAATMTALTDLDLDAGDVAVKWKQSCHWLWTDYSAVRGFLNWKEIIAGSLPHTDTQRHLTPGIMGIIQIIDKHPIKCSGWTGVAAVHQSSTVLLQWSLQGSSLFIDCWLSEGVHQSLLYIVSQSPNTATLQPAFTFESSCTSPFNT